MHVLKIPVFVQPTKMSQQSLLGFIIRNLKDILIIIAKLQLVTHFLESSCPYNYTICNLKDMVILLACKHWYSLGVRFEKIDFDHTIPPTYHSEARDKF